MTPDLALARRPGAAAPRGAGAGAGALEVAGLSRRFGSRQALDGVSFTVPPGEMFGFVGSNGAGKTTTMRIVLGVLSADAGQVLRGGRPMTRADRARIGYMPEERGLYPKMRVGELLVHLARLHGAPAAAAERAAREWTGRLGIGGRLRDEVQQLSLGNQQRVQLAAALVHDPDLLVLDEPFSGLDPLTADLLGEVLRDKCAQGVPVVFSSHQLDLVERLCDRAGVIGSGRMIACGQVDELRGRGARRLEVEVPPAADAAVAAVPGVRSPRRSGARLTVELDPGADDQQVLAAALAAGPVTAFVPRKPSLSDVFRDLMAGPGAADATTGEG
jgi:ABC-2 type transport system ATP-binding protein